MIEDEHLKTTKKYPGDSSFVSRDRGLDSSRSELIEEPEQVVRIPSRNPNDMRAEGFKNLMNQMNERKPIAPAT